MPNTSNSTGVTLGDAVLLQRGIHTNVNWIWIGVGTLLGFAAIFNALLVLAFDNIPGKGLRCLHFGQNKLWVAALVAIPVEAATNGLDASARSILGEEDAARLCRLQVMTFFHGLLCALAFFFSPSYNEPSAKLTKVFIQPLNLFPDALQCQRLKVNAPLLMSIKFFKWSLHLFLRSVAAFGKTVGAMPEEQVLERRRGSPHDSGKVHSLSAIQEDEPTSSADAVHIEMGDVAHRTDVQAPSESLNLLSALEIEGER